MPTTLLWLIPLLPLLSFLVIVFGLIVGPGRQGSPRIGGYVTILGIAGSFALAIYAFLAAVLAWSEAVAVRFARLLEEGRS